jgi:hypothetical protein
LVLGVSGSGNCHASNVLQFSRRWENLCHFPSFRPFELARATFSARPL